jgi:uncharacterized protein YndB with AHSA1/START domain
VNKPSAVYVTYIASTPEAVWNALIDPKLTTQYWFNHHNQSDWAVGSPWKHLDLTDGETDISGTVLESNPPHKLVLSWAAPLDAGTADATSRVTFEIEAQAELVKLVVTHDELGARMAASINRGWPMVIASLKTLLETGKPLAFAV